MAEPKSLPFQDPDPWLTVAQASVHADVHPTSTYRAIKTGRLRAAQIGGMRSYRIRKSWADAWLAGEEVPRPVAPAAPIRLAKGDRP